MSTHRICVFCGGNRPATTIEHCPPRALFEEKQWPVGFEFPACDDCNGGTRNQDLLVSMMARFDPGASTRNQDGASFGLMKRAHDQFPRLFEGMMMSPTEARRANRELGIEPAPGQLHQEVSPVKITPEINHAVRTLAGKLTKGIYFRETKRIFPDDGCLLLNWFSNIDLVRHGKYVVFDLLKDLAGAVPPVNRSGKALNDQFEYKLSLSGDFEFITLQARFGNAFGFVTFGCASHGPLEGIVERLMQQTKTSGPFAVIQSRSLPLS